MLSVRDFGSALVVFVVITQHKPASSRIGDRNLHMIRDKGIMTSKPERTGSLFDMDWIAPIIESNQFIKLVRSYS